MSPVDVNPTQTISPLQKKQVMLDIVIPVLNEERILIKKESYYKDLKEKFDIIFVDGGSTDRTVEIAKNYGTVINEKKGRAIQKNRGVKESKNDNLLFLHVDSFVNIDKVDKIGEVLDSGAIGGCFTMHIDDPKFIFRIYETIVNIRAKYLGIVDGDLGLFVKRKTFEKLGCFDHFLLMDDIIFSKRLRRLGKIQRVEDLITVSSRKWYEKGFIRTFWQYSLAYVLHWTGMLKKI